MNKKHNLAFITSASSGLAHYTTQIFKPIKKYVNPYYITYSGVSVDEIVIDNVGKVRQLVKNNDSFSILMTLKFFKDKKIDIANFHVGTTARKCHLHFIALLSKLKLNGVKIIGTIHDVMPFESFYINPAAIELLYSCIDHYIVGSEEESNKLQLYFQIPEKKITVIPHGPYTIFDKKKYSKESARKKLNIPKNKKVILFFGQLKPHKGLEYLVKAFKAVVKEVPDAWLYISTDLSYSPQLNDFLQRIEKTGAGDRIQLVSKYVSSYEIEAIFKASDLVVLPYTQVSQSGVLNLAYAFKKPVVVTDVFSDTVKIKDHFGKVAVREDVVSLKNCITELLKDPSKMENYGNAAYDYATNENGWDKMAEEMDRIIKEL